ncbi:hypothetical protein I79_014680 [Cricetulus griseus]|uniref:Uncharacterized protein n=1 Tax=Cricetulus griseus TaxID=10029 RepID=G3HUR4_CRIGR|nr:hypothetical protein I79_014680 [Cricetulus griseus]
MGDHRHQTAASSCNLRHQNTQHSLSPVVLLGGIWPTAPPGGHTPHTTEQGRECCSLLPTIQKHSQGLLLLLETQTPRRRALKIFSPQFYAKILF